MVKQNLDLDMLNMHKMSINPKIVFLRYNCLYWNESHIEIILHCIVAWIEEKKVTIIILVTWTHTKKPYLRKFPAIHRGSNRLAFFLSPSSITTVLSHVFSSSHRPSLPNHTHQSLVGVADRQRCWRSKGFRQQRHSRSMMTRSSIKTDEKGFWTRSPTKSEGERRWGEKEMK